LGESITTDGFENRVPAAGKSFHFLVIFQCQLLADVIPSYRYVTPEEMRLAPKNAVGGTFCMTLSVQTDKFLPWAMHK
jgi:hypothetical protein